MNFESERQRAVNAIYQIAAAKIEIMENKRMIRGNGHHIAQLIADYADDLLKRRQVVNDPNQIKTRIS